MVTLVLFDPLWNMSVVLANVWHTEYWTHCSEPEHLRTHRTATMGAVMTMGTCQSHLDPFKSVSHSACLMVGVGVLVCCDPCLADRQVLLCRVCQRVEGAWAGQAEWWRPQREGKVPPVWVSVLAASRVPPWGSCVQGERETTIQIPAPDLRPDVIAAELTGSIRQALIVT